MMTFMVLYHNNDNKIEWLNDVQVNTLEELREACLALNEKYQTEVQVDFRGETIFIGHQTWC